MFEMITPESSNRNGFGITDPEFPLQLMEARWVFPPVCPEMGYPSHVVGHLTIANRMYISMYIHIYIYTLIYTYNDVYI